MEDPMQFTLTDTNLGEIEADAAIALVYESDDACSSATDWDGLTEGLAKELAATGEFKAKHQSTALIHRPAGMRTTKPARSACAKRPVRAGGACARQGCAASLLHFRTAWTATPL